MLGQKKKISFPALMNESLTFFFKSFLKIISLLVTDDSKTF
jgi:hypothetical protein